MPASIEEPEAFEDDLLKRTSDQENVKKLQKHLRQDKERRKGSKDVIVPADCKSICDE